MVIKSEYKRLRRYLDLNISKEDFETQKELRTIMNGLGIRTNTFMLNRDKQLHYAWDYLKGKSYFKRDINYSIERRETYSVYRANKTLIFRGKTYRKGQFIPKQRD